jgi:hypothetical protein
MVESMRERFGCKGSLHGGHDATSYKDHEGHTVPRKQALLALFAEHSTGSQEKYETRYEMAEYHIITPPPKKQGKNHD